MSTDVPLRCPLIALAEANEIEYLWSLLHKTLTECLNRVGCMPSGLWPNYIRLASLGGSENRAGRKPVSKRSYKESGPKVAHHLASMPSENGMRKLPDVAVHGAPHRLLIPPKMQ